MSWHLLKVSLMSLGMCNRNYKFDHYLTADIIVMIITQVIINHMLCAIDIGGARIAFKNRYVFLG